MKRIVLLFFLSIACCNYVFSQQFPDSVYAPGIVIVKLKSQYATQIFQDTISDDSQLAYYLSNELVNLVSFEPLHLFYKQDSNTTQSNFSSYFENIFIIQFNSEYSMSEILSSYLEKGYFEYASPDFIAKAEGKASALPLIPNDSLFASRQWNHYNDGTFTYNGLPSAYDADIDSEKAWEITQGDSAVVVCIIDSGTKLDHPEFKGRLWYNISEIPDNQKDDDKNGFVDDWLGWDFFNNDNDPSDDFGHGTHVSGILAANGNNNIGYAGMDWHCKLMICKMLGSSGNGSSSNIAQAIVYAVNNGADVINLSLVTAFDNPLLRDAVKYAHEQGVVTVAAIGNYGNSALLYPAAYPESIAVGFTNSLDNRSQYSNYGTHIDVVAPGQSIYGLRYDSNTDYNYLLSGSSMATPLVSGLATLLLAKNSRLKPEEVRQIIRRTAQDQVGNPSEDTPGWDPFYGYGRINAGEALEAVNVPVLPQVISFTLIDADTNEDILELTDGMTLNNSTIFNKNLSIRANTSPSQVGSVSLVLEGEFRHKQSENIFPYSLFGDNTVNGYLGRGFLAGNYRISAVPFTGKLLSGEAGETKSLTFKVKGQPTITQLVLVDAYTGKDIKNLEDTTLVDISSFVIGISLRAEVSDARGVIFTIKDANDSVIHQRTEKIKPLSLFGDDLHGNYYPWYPPQGNYQLSIVPFIDADLVEGSGALGSRLVSLQITDIEYSNSSRTFTVFPNVSSGFVHLTSTSSIPGNYPFTLEIYKYPNKRVFEQVFSEELDLSLDLSLFGKGLFIAQLSDQEGVIQKRIMIE